MTKCTAIINEKDDGQGCHCRPAKSEVPKPPTRPPGASPEKLEEFIKRHYASSEFNAWALLLQRKDRHNVLGEIEDLSQAGQSQLSNKASQQWHDDRGNSQDGNGRCQTPLCVYHDVALLHMFYYRLVLIESTLIDLITKSKPHFVGTFLYIAAI